MTKPEDFYARTRREIRRIEANQYHVDNVFFPIFCDEGRTAITLDPGFTGLTPGMQLMVARFAIDYRAELFWPDSVEIGTAIKTIGNSSITFFQALFQNGKCAATAEAVMVQVDRTTRRPVALSDAAKAWLRTYRLETN